jgi:uncharacterized protein (TIGR02453 family)
MNKRAFSAFPKEGLQFLRSLKRHNNREWFQAHRSIYEQHLKQPMAELIDALAADFSQFAPEMIASVKSSAYRIHRDTRFSNDKSPYKTHVAAVFPRSGLGKHEGAAFYLHVAPSEVLVGGGLYMPLPEDLASVRERIAENPKLFLNILGGRRFRSLFGSISGAQLMRVPRGFSPDHVAADYLKYKQFLASRNLEASVACEPGFYDLVVETFRAMLPFIRFLNDPILRSRRTKQRQRALLTF